ncbi:MAG: hypothetical protein HOV80_16560 [Polyangiaceae bacterium]|nr:hypothetical protein [Polyangiaceae bacterium]
MTAPLKAGAPRAIADRRGIKLAKDNTTQHSAMVNLIRLALGRIPDLVLWPNPVKNVEIVTGNGGLIRMRTGLAVGSADLIGILAGRFIALEVKTGDGFAKPHQEQWLALVRAKGGFAAVVWSVLEACEAIDRARQGKSE